MSHALVHLRGFCCLCIAIKLVSLHMYDWFNGVDFLWNTYQRIVIRHQYHLFFFV